MARDGFARKRPVLRTYTMSVGNDGKSTDAASVS